MSGPPPLVRIPVGVVVERRKAASPWQEFIWRPVAVLGGRADAAPGTQLAADGDTAMFYAGAADIELYRSEADNYRGNLAAAAPSVWVSLRPTGGEQPYEVAAGTADPAEGEAWTETGTMIVEAIAMPEPVCATVAAFVAGHHVEHGFEKRVRDRADLEALGRHALNDESGDGRPRK